MLTTLARLFRLKPYGNHLIDGMAELWLVLAAVNIASIALCDAVAWAYFGYTTAHGWTAWGAAVLAGVIVFLLVGSLDAMFIMHDRTREGVGDTVVASGLWQRLRGNIHRDHLAMAARIVLVILTFTVTAPFLTQLFFSRDIRANIERQNEQQIASGRAEIAGRFDGRMEELRSRLSDRREDLEQEIAGSGASGRYGFGPTAAAIEMEIRQLEPEIADLAEAKAAALRGFDQATPAVLASRYGIDLVREGPETRARAVAELEKSASFRAARRTIKAFLVFMFLGLLCLKLFQPESVRVYYSARLQSEHARWRAGVFDHRLDPRELPQTGGMSPVRFADWYDNDQQVREMTERMREQTALAIERMKAQEDAVRALQETLRADLTRLRDDLTAASKASEQLEQEVSAFQRELDSINAKIAEEQQQLDDFRYDEAGDLPLRDQQLLIASRNRTVRQLTEHRAAAGELVATLARINQRLDANRSYENQLRVSIASAGEETATLAAALQRTRQRRLDDIVG
jgi:hypothetical protein